jgi:hypothetical protein
LATSCFFLLCRAVADHCVKPADVMTDVPLASFYADLERKWCPRTCSPVLGASGLGSVFRQRMLHSSAVLIDLDSESDFEVVSNVAVPLVCDAVAGLSSAAPKAMSSGQNLADTSSSDESDEEGATDGELELPVSVVPCIAVVPVVRPGLGQVRPPLRVPSGRLPARALSSAATSAVARPAVARPEPPAELQVDSFVSLRVGKEYDLVHNGGTNPGQWRTLRVVKVTPFHIKAFHDSSFKCFLGNYILDAKDVAGQEVVERNVRPRIDPGPRYERPVKRSSARR